MRLKPSKMVCNEDRSFRFIGIHGLLLSITWKGNVIVSLSQKFSSFLFLMLLTPSPPSKNANQLYIYIYIYIKVE